MPVGYIYKLESSFEDPGIYVGSTVDLNKRKSQHKFNCNNSNSQRYNLILYQYIRDYGGWSNWFMLTLEEFEYEDKKQLRDREQYWIKELKSNLNTIDAIMDIDYIKNYNKKYKSENKEKLKGYSKKYYVENKKKLNEKILCECGSEYTHRNKPRHIKSTKHQSYISSKVI